MNVAMVRSGALKQQHHLTTLCQYLIAQGVGLEFIGLQSSECEAFWFKEQVPGIKAKTLGLLGGNKIARFVRGGFALRRSLREMQFDLLYVVDSWTLPYLFVATLGTMRLGKTAIVYHTFDLLAPGDHGRIYFALERYMARRSKLNINTDRPRAEVSKLMIGLKKTPISVPLRMLRDTILPKSNYSLRASFLGNVGKEQKYLVVYPTKLGPDRLSKEVISAFANLPESYHLVTIDSEGSYAHECKSYIDRFNLTGRVHLISPMPHEGVLDLCACADLGLIFHDIDGGIGNYFCHPGRMAYFIALGLPFVASNVPTLEAFVYRYGLGSCCSPYEPASIASAIRDVCEGQVPIVERAKQIRDVFKRELYYEKAAGCLMDELNNIFINNSSRK